MDGNQRSRAMKTKLQAINELRRQVKKVKVQVTATTPDGKSHTEVVTLKANKLGKTSLTGLQVYKLKRGESVEITNWTGTTMTYKIVGAEAESNVERLSSQLPEIPDEPA
jgi:uncharacterized protein YggU (UPF0235/DUF167 family)